MVTPNERGSGNGNETKRSVYRRQSCIQEREKYIKTEEEHSEIGRRGVMDIGIGCLRGQNRGVQGSPGKPVTRWRGNDGYALCNWRSDSHSIKSVNTPMESM